MPKKYEAIRDKYIAEGMDAADAKSHAARIYNAQRKPGEPTVHGGSGAHHKIHPNARGNR